jgi:hypothetical protein
VVNGELPRPHIGSAEPSAVPMNTANLVLTIKGKNFNAANRVLWEDVDLRVLSLTPTEMTVAVPIDVVREPGTRKIHMITGGRVQQESENFAEVLVTFGRTFKQRWNGQTRGIGF